MNKSKIIQHINNTVGNGRLTNSNTRFASISSSRLAWWINIPLGKFTEDLNIVLADELHLIWLAIPNNTFKQLHTTFRIWEAKNVVDLYISCDRNNMYLHDIASDGSNVDFRPYIKEKIKYPESLKNEIARIKTTRNVEKRNSEAKSHQEILKKDQTGVSYHKLFAKYLNGSKNITIQDPYIRLPHQFKNLLEFCVMLANDKNYEDEINLMVVTWNDSNFMDQSNEYFEELVPCVKELGIHLSFRFEKHHDRFIEADNGYKIILGRGLDIFERPQGRFVIGDIDQNWRKCKPCEMTYLKN